MHKDHLIEALCSSRKIWKNYPEAWFCWTLSHIYLFVCAQIHVSPVQIQLHCKRFSFLSPQDSFIFNSTGVTLDETNIAWQTDRDTRFKNTVPGKNITASQLNGTTMPPSWPRDLSYLPNGLENEHLIVWFRVSAFWKFKKLYGRLYAYNSTVLPNGTYSLNVEYSILIYLYIVFCLFVQLLWLASRLSCEWLQRCKVLSVIWSFLAWWEEQLSRHCIHCNWHSCHHRWDCASSSPFGMF